MTAVPGTFSPHVRIALNWPMHPISSSFRINGPLVVFPGRNIYWQLFFGTKGRLFNATIYCTMPESQYSHVIPFQRIATLYYRIGPIGLDLSFHKSNVYGFQGSIYEFGSSFGVLDQELISITVDLEFLSTFMAGRSCSVCLIVGFCSFGNVWRRDGDGSACA
jgi:hypothetical protein